MMRDRDQIISDLKKALEEMPLDNLQVLTDLLTTFSELSFERSDRATSIRPAIIRSFASSLLTDDERGRSVNFPVQTRIRENAKILNPEKLKIGSNSWVGEGAILDASGGLEIGSHTSIGPGVYIWSHSSHLSNLNFEGEISSRLIERTPTKIGDGVFIAGPSVVLAGSTIGNKCIIRPMSVVNGDVPDYSIVDGHQVKEGVLNEEAIASMTAQFLKKKSR